MDKLHIALIQTEMIWENAERNREMLGHKIEVLSTPVDIVVLPEMFSTGFTMEPHKVAETMDGPTVKWLKQIATHKKVAITGSLVIEEDGHYYNRLLFIEPSGKISKYDKRHTFTLAGEDKVYSAGTQKLIVDYKGWKICPLVCYDLRFPVWSRNQENYDVLIYVASWPAKRMVAWDTLLKARAIENMSYCVGVNRVGKDGNNHEYSGNSAAYDVLGERLDSIPVNKEAVEIITLDKQDLQAKRAQFNFLLDQDQFSIM